MQSKTTLFIVVSAVVVVVAVLAMVYWPESEQLVASRDLLSATEEAGALWQEAEDLLGTSVYLSPDGQHWPNAGQIDQARSTGIRHARPQAVNPEALDRLTRADELLTQAIERCQMAAPADRAVALRLSARINALTALYYERLAVISKMADDEGGSGLEVLLAKARRQTDELNQLVRLLDSFIGEGDDDLAAVQASHSEAAAARAEVFEVVTARQQELDGFHDTVTALTEKIETLSVQVSEHRAASRASESAAEELANLKKAQAIEADIVDLRNEIEAEQRKIELGEDALAALTLQVGSMDSRVRDLAASLKKLEAENQQSQAAATETRGKIDTLLAEFTQTLTYLNTALADADAAQKAATEHRTRAIASLTQAGEIATVASPESVVNRASAHAATRPRRGAGAVLSSGCTSPRRPATGAKTARQLRHRGREGGRRPLDSRRRSPAPGRARRRERVYRAALARGRGGARGSALFGSNRPPPAVSAGGTAASAAARWRGTR